MEPISTAIAIVASALVGELINYTHAKEDADKERYASNIRALINLKGIEKQALVDTVANMSEDYANVMSSLGYATRGGTAHSYRNRKSQEYIQKRYNNQQQQQLIEKQIAALEKLI